MKRMLALSLIFMCASINGSIWNTPDYSQSQTVVVEEQPVRVVVQQPVYRSSHYHPGRPVTTAVEGAGNTVDAAAQGVSNVVHSDRPVRAAVDGAVDTADTAVESAANTIRSIFR